MEAAKLHLANGLVRVVKGRAEDVGASLKKRAMSEDDRIRHFIAIDGGALSVNADAVMMVEAAAEKKAKKKVAFGFSRALEG